jgi:poly(3-hydroxybutyrate) depolymerase
VQEPDPRLVEGSPLRYLLSVPRAAAAGASPVLCFLHGYDEAAPVDIHRALTRHGPLRPGSSPLAASEFIVVAPQLPRAGDLWHRYADAVRQIVTGVQQAHGGDPRRTYLSGFSFGGNGVFDLAIARRDFWAALWPVDPTRVPREDPGRPVWLSIGEVARYGRNAFIRTLELKPAAATPEGDRVYLDEGEDHVGSATLAYRDERIYRWLLSKELPAAG